MGRMEPTKNTWSDGSERYGIEPQTFKDPRTFELVYRSGGHGGPYENHTSAVIGAMRYLQGFKYVDDTVTVTPRWLAVDSTADPREHKLDALQIIRAGHVCSCSACPARGEVFYHVRIVKVRPF